jgi:prepilin-type N-terminal cleavage/methylation domain-containing protein
MEGGRVMQRTSPRKGFTLIELLVVISIIAALMGLLLPAVQAARQASFRASSSSDIAQLTQAIEQYKSTYTVKYLPAGFISRGQSTQYQTAGVSAPEDDSRIYLKTTWRNTISGTGPFNSAAPHIAGTLNGSQCMVFFLGGPGWFTGAAERGFAGGSNPFVAGGDRKIFFDFPTRRIANGQFLDPWGTPYYYFSMKDGNDYAYFGIYYGITNGADYTYSPAGGGPAVGAIRNPAIPQNFQNSHSFQIITLGKNRVFDGSVRRDDQYNFAN